MWKAIWPRKLVVDLCPHFSWPMSNYSEVKNDTYWGKSVPPPFAAQVQHCLNQTQESGVYMGISECTLTYVCGNHCLTDSCQPVNCSWLRNNPWFLQSEPQKYCELVNSTNESFVRRQLGWVWMNKTGHQKLQTLLVTATERFLTHCSTIHKHTNITIGNTIITIRFLIHVHKSGIQDTNHVQTSWNL